MSDKDNPASDGEQLAAIPTDYRALLATTRPLVIAEHTLPSWRGGEICRLGFGIPLIPAHCRVESTLRRGEIVYRDKSPLGITGEEGLATLNEQMGMRSAREVEDKTTEARFATLPQTDSNMRIRIYLGMS